MGRSGADADDGRPSDQPAPAPTRGQVTRGLLVDAALELFVEHGVHATSVDAITARAEVAKGTFYVHVQRKEDVLLEWAARFVDGVDEHALAEEGVAGLEHLADELSERMAQRPRELVGRTMREIMGNSADWLRVLDRRPPLNAVIQPIVEAAQEAGDLRDDLSARRLSMSLTVVWLDNIIGWAERERARPLDESMRLTLDLFLRGAATGS